MMSSVLLLGLISLPRIETTQAINDFQRETNFVGMSVAVWRNGQVEYARSFGYEDREKDIPANEKTIYRLGSISKPITAITLMKLVEGGKLNLKDDVRTWVPDWPEDKPGITLQHIMLHTSGIRHYSPIEKPVFENYASARLALDLFKNDKLIGGVGEKFSYSTHAWTLAGAAMESASGQSLPKLVAEISGPDSSLRCEDLTQPSPERRSALYRAVEDKESTLESKREDNSWKYAGGGMESSASDLAQFISRYLAGDVLQPKTVSQMTTAIRNGRGLGWGVSGDMIIHGGSQQGCSTYFCAFKSSRTVVVILSNTERLPIKEIGDRVAAIWRR